MGKTPLNSLNPVYYLIEHSYTAWHLLLIQAAGVKWLFYMEHYGDFRSIDIWSTWEWEALISSKWMMNYSPLGGTADKSSGPLTPPVMRITPWLESVIELQHLLLAIHYLFIPKWAFISPISLSVFQFSELDMTGFQHTSTNIEKMLPTNILICAAGFWNEACLDKWK